MTNLLETERLIIRSWIPERYAEQAFVIYSDPEVTHFLGKASLVTSIESQRQRLIRGRGQGAGRAGGAGGAGEEKLFIDQCPMTND